METYDKYAKYKNKYLKLKMQHGGDGNQVFCHKNIDKNSYNCFINDNTYDCEGKINCDDRDINCYELNDYKNYNIYDLGDAITTGNGYNCKPINKHYNSKLFVVDAGNHNHPFNNNYFSPVGLYIDGKKYVFNNAEFAYQAIKLTGLNMDTLINRISIIKPTRNNNGSEYLKDVQLAPGLNKRALMKTVLESKFSHKMFDKLLLNTGDRYILFHSNRELEQPDYWSDAPNGTGYNIIGELLMKIRDSGSASLYNKELIEFYKTININFTIKEINKILLDRQNKLYGIEIENNEKVPLPVIPNTLPVGHKLAEYTGENIIAFYGQLGNIVLGNFYLSDISYPLDSTNYTFKCAEAAFQACKVLHMGSPIDSNTINYFTTLDGDGAYQFAQDLHFSTDFHTNKYEYMYKILKVKFSNELLKQLLLSTGDKYLIEHKPYKPKPKQKPKLGQDPKPKYPDDWTDNFDGIYGYNALGQLLMRVRDHYRNGSDNYDVKQINHIDQIRADVLNEYNTHIRGKQI